MFISRLITLIACFIFAHSALAHKLNVFTYVEGKQVFVEGYFADGKRAKNSQVKVYNDKREIVTEGMTNEEGEFSFFTPEVTTLRIHLDAGMGHAAEYTLSASEFNVTGSSDERTTLSSQAALSATTNDMQNIASHDEIKVLVEQAVSSAVKPLVREIAELKNKTNFSDIVGGIGFILGALGLFAYLKARKTSP